MLYKLAKILTRKPALVITIAVLLLVPSLYGIISTEVNYDILTYLPEDLDSTKGQDLLENTFQNAANSMLIIDNMSSRDVLNLKEKIKKVKGVNDVIWVDDIVDIAIPKQILPKNFKDIFYRENSTLLLIKYDNTSSSKITMSAIEEIRGYLNKQCFLSGMSAIVKDTRELADHEMPIYVGLAVVLSIIAMLLCMESWLLPFIFILGIFFAIVYNFGSNIFLGNISYITKSIAAILQLGVTMDYSIFLINRYDEEKPKYKDCRDAMAMAIKNTFVSISGSSLTTVAGFMALCFMQLRLGKDIGIVMMKGVILGVLTVVTVLPALILQFDKPIHKYTHKNFMPKFNKTTDFIVKHYKFFIILFLVAFLPAVFAKSNTKVYYKLSDSLPDDLDSIVAVEKLKDTFDMSTTHFIMIDNDIPGYKVKEMVGKIEDLDGIETVLAYDKLIGPAVPESFIPDEAKEVFKKDNSQMIMVNSKYKAATDDVNSQIDKLTDIVKSYDSECLIAGEGPLTKDLIEIADHDFRVTSYVSMLSIFLLVAICFRSITIPLILVASIELAIFINLGIPYFTGTVIPFITPTVIGCVQLGATVDYAILLTTRFREELVNGHDRIEAMRIAAKASDKSIITSALVFFCATWGVALISNIEIIENICFMLARGALISAAVIMFILSSILLVTEKIINKTTYKWK